MEVVVTGGSGFIGRFLVDRLVAGGHRVTVLDRIDPQREDVEAVVGDIRDPSAVDAAVTEGTGAVFHLAAVTSVLASKEDPQQTFDVNVAATQLLIERARQVEAPSFVLASTNAVAGETGGAPISESTPLAPLTPYGATKAAGEMILSAYGASYGMACASVRLTNIYGTGMGEKDSFIPRLARAAMSGNPTVSIYGDGLQVRDLLYISDAVEGLVLARDQGVSGALTIGFGQPYSVLDLHASMCEATGIDIAAIHVEPKAGEMRAVVVDTSRARSLGFEPKVTLRDGLARTWRDFTVAAGRR